MEEKKNQIDELANKIRESAEKMKEELNNFQESFLEKAATFINGDSDQKSPSGTPGYKRGFEIVKPEHRKFLVDIQAPMRSTTHSAGYDLFSNEDYELKPIERHVFWMDIKVFMMPGEVFKIYVRSSLGFKHGIQIANGTGIIDKDYYSNVDNDGNIGVCLINLSDTVVKINKGDRIAQGIFEYFLEAETGFQVKDEERKGGIGSTN